MPYNWCTLSNTPAPWDAVSGDPVKYRDAIEKTVEHFGAKLHHMFWSVTEHKSYALVEGPHDPIKLKAMLKALPSHGITPMLDHAEAQQAYEHACGAPAPGAD